VAFLKRAWLLALAAMCLAEAARGQSSEYKLKAAYLCRLVDYVDWPADSFASSNSPLVIGILGRDPFGAALDTVAEGQVSRGHPLQVRRYASASEVGDCQELFICASEAPKLAAILKELEGRAILTVGDVGNFTDRGGVIRFHTEANKVRFRINLDAAKADRVTISSRLLQLAEIANEGKSPP